MNNKIKHHYNKILKTALSGRQCFPNPILGVWFDKSEKSWKMDSGPGSPFGREDNTLWTSWMFHFGGFTDSPHPHKQETRGLQTIQATSFFPWWLLLFFQENLDAKGEKRSWNQEKSWEITDLDTYINVKIVGNIPDVFQSPIWVSLFLRHGVRDVCHQLRKETVWNVVSRFVLDQSSAVNQNP